MLVYVMCSWFGRVMSGHAKRFLVLFEPETSVTARCEMCKTHKSSGPLSLATSRATVVLLTVYPEGQTVRKPQGHKLDSRVTSENNRDHSPTDGPNEF